MLFSADFRGEERMAQLLTQVAGRAGREGLGGQVLIQTHYPDHPALRALVAQDYADHARELLRQREAAGLPPAGQMLLLRCDCRDAGAAEQFLSALRGTLEGQLPAGCLAIGPLPSPLPRRAGQYRFQLTLTAPNRSTARALACRAVAAGECLPANRGLNWSIDIDPQDVY